MIRRTPRNSRLAILIAILALPFAGCASLGGSAPVASGESVGLQVRNGIELQLAVWLDGRILDFVPPLQTVCVRIPIPFQEGVITITDNQLPVRNSITQTSRTRFETQSGWSVSVQVPIRRPAQVTPSPACA